MNIIIPEGMEYEPSPPDVIDRNEYWVSYGVYDYVYPHDSFSYLDQYATTRETKIVNWKKEGF